VDVGMEGVRGVMGTLTDDTSVVEGVKERLGIQLDDLNLGDSLPWTAAKKLGAAGKEMGIRWHKIDETIQNGTQDESMTKLISILRCISV
jgi:hypothetical protein